MTTQLLTAVCVLLFSNLLMPVISKILSKKDAVLRKYLCLCTLFYISGTLLITIITLVKPAVPMTWVWLCEVFVFGIYAGSCGMVIYVVKKFAEGLNPPANVNTDNITKKTDDTKSTEDSKNPDGKDE